MLWDGRKRIDDVLRARRLNRKMGRRRIAREGKASRTAEIPSRRTEAGSTIVAAHASRRAKDSARDTRVRTVPRMAATV
jgi:hypothetical protein